MSALKTIPKRNGKSPSGSNGRRPTWEIANFYPPQGDWTEDDFFDLDSALEAAPRVELVQGRLEVLPMPTEIHQTMMVLLMELLKAFTLAHAPGKVLCSGLKVRVKNGAHPKYRDPDVVYMKAENRLRRHKKYWDGADLIMEIISGSKQDRKRDWDIKPKDYAAAGIPEYWIIDPKKQLIRVLTLVGKKYAVHGDFPMGAEATSVLLPGFRVSVAAVMRANDD